MKKCFLPAVLPIALLAIAVPAMGQSAKNAVAIKDLTGLPPVSAKGIKPGVPVEGEWRNVLTTALHTSQQKDLIVGLSLQCGLMTDTSVASSGGTKASANVESLLQVEVLVDGMPLSTWPYSGPSGQVTMARRAQTLWAKLSGIIAIDPVTGAVTITGPEEIGLILDTMDAHHFDWVVANVGVGDHTVTVNARAALTSTEIVSGTAAASAWLGWGALTVEEVRLVKDATPLAP